jgi:hypothetical protein
VQSCKAIKNKRDQATYTCYCFVFPVMATETVYVLVLFIIPGLNYISVMEGRVLPCVKACCGDKSSCCVRCTVLLHLFIVWRYCAEWPA